MKLGFSIIIDYTLCTGLLDLRPVTEGKILIIIIPKARKYFKLIFTIYCVYYGVARYETEGKHSVALYFTP